jgi:Uncharacterized conserved protein (COG2071)
MKFPVIRGVIDRRILVNYRADPEVVEELLPAPFRPKVINGFAVVGICLIRLRKLRPTFLPSWFGISSENAAHRIAVEWDEDGSVREGVFVRRRDSNSWLCTLGGGWLFPGVLHHARFEVIENADRYRVDLQSGDGTTRISVRGRQGKQLPPTSLFESLDEASAFFRAGALGYSPIADPTRFQGLELRCSKWRIEPLDVEVVRSSYFEDEAHFPRGSIEFDSAFLMRGIAHEWHGHPDLVCPIAVSEPAGSYC